MFTNFGWKTALGIVIANALYFLVFRNEFAKLKKSGISEQSILSKYFSGGVSPIGLAAGATIPTIIMGLCFMLIR